MNIKDISVFNNNIINGDSLKFIRTLSDESINVIFTSSPYNLKNSTGDGMKDGLGEWPNAALFNGYESYDDNMLSGEYSKWQYKNLKKSIDC